MGERSCKGREARTLARGPLIEVAGYVIDVLGATHPPAHEQQIDANRTTLSAVVVDATLIMEK